MGDSFRSIAVSFQLGISTVACIVKSTCEAIWDVLAPVYIPVPSTTDWEEHSDSFHTKWQFPNCCRAVDGKHCTINAPPNSGTLYFNYKKTFSVVMLAVVDAFYKFVLIEIGSMGSEGDNSIFRNCNFGKDFMSDQLNLPQLRYLPGTSSNGLDWR